MKEIIVLKVNSKENMDDFIQFPNLLYADCPYYVPDLDMDVQATFNPQKIPDWNSPKFKHSLLSIGKESY